MGSFSKTFNSAKFLFQSSHSERKIGSNCFDDQQSMFGQLDMHSWQCCKGPGKPGVEVEHLLPRGRWQRTPHRQILHDAVHRHAPALHPFEKPARDDKVPAMPLEVSPRIDHKPTTSDNHSTTCLMFASIGPISRNPGIFGSKSSRFAFGLRQIPSC